jgi:hypothetical protein
MQDSGKSLYWDQALRRTQVYEFIQKVKVSEKNLKMGAQFWIGKHRRCGGLDVCQAVPGSLAPSLQPWAHTYRLLHALKADNHLPGKTLTKETSKKE